MAIYQIYCGWKRDRVDPEVWHVVTSQPMLRDRPEDVVIATVTGPQAEQVAMFASGFKNNYAKEYYEVDNNGTLLKTNT